MRKKARVMLSTVCSRGCDYCCNTHPDQMEGLQVLPTMDVLNNYEEIIVTGGEPLEFAELTEAFIMHVRKYMVNKKIFMYISRYDNELFRACSLCDGITFALHSSRDYGELAQFEQDIVNMIDASYRLWVLHPTKEERMVDAELNTGWSYVGYHKIQQPGGCPPREQQNEDLFILSKSLREILT